MYILAFDTCLNNCSVGLATMTNIVFYKRNITQQSQCESLVNLINLSLKKSNIEYKDLRYVCCAVGPGSFTGIRVGTSCISAILALTKAQPITFTTFEMLQFRAQKQVQNIQYLFTIIKAYKQMYYVCNFDLRTNTNVSDNKTMHADQIIEYLKQFDATQVACAGNIVQDIKLIDALYNLKIQYLPRFGCAKTLLNMCLASVKNNKPLKSDIKPLYINPASTNISTSYTKHKNTRR